LSDRALSAGFLRAVLDTLPAGLAIYDAEWRLTYANPALWQQAGEGMESLPPGSTLSDVTALMARNGHYGSVDPEKQARGATVLDGTRPLRLLARNAAGRWHELTSTPLPGGGGVSLSVDVTGIHRSESEARTHAALLETILEKLDSGIAGYDRRGHLRYFNPAYQRLIGAVPGVLRLGMAMGEVLDHLEAVGQLLNLTEEQRARLPRGPLKDALTTSRMRPDGVVLWTRARPVPEGGHLVEVDDITALRHAEDEARRRAALLDGVLTALPHGVCVYGADWRVLMVNAAYQQIMKGSEVTIGEHHSDIVARRLAAGEYDEEVARTLLQASTGYGGVELLDRVRTRPDGTVLSIRGAILPGGGQVTVMTDITARHRAEAEAERRAAILRDMLDNQSDGIALFDANGYLIAANALSARMTGLSVEDMAPGRHLMDLRALQIAAHEFGNRGDETRAFVASRGEQPLVHHDRYIRRRPDGTVLEVRTDPTPDGGFIRTYRDVTEERRIRAELETARDAAEAASRAKSRFLATMTHELRTPLNAVIGFSEAILDEARPETVRAHAAEVLAAGKHLLGLVDGLLEATRIEAGGLSLRGAAFDPAPVLRAAVDAAREPAEKADVTLRVDIPAQLPHLRGDEPRLRQVLDALLSNAVKFTPGGGQVTVSAVAEPRGGSVIHVRDTGIGMAEEDIPRAFEAFTQLEAGLARHYPGSGLGLYLARALAGAMGMRLTLESAPGRGTTARLAFPAATQETSP
jgi:PAS domain S-box-containing protein